MSPRTGLLRGSNTVVLNGQPVKQMLEQQLDREVRIANDANCFALSEAVDGCRSRRQDVFGAILGTGVGAGVVIDGARCWRPARHRRQWGQPAAVAGG